MPIGQRTRLLADGQPRGMCRRTIPACVVVMIVFSPETWDSSSLIDPHTRELAQISHSSPFFAFTLPRSFDSPPFTDTSVKTE